MSLETIPINYPDKEVINELFNIFIADHSPDDKAEYQEEKTRAIMQGQPTWVRRNLDDTQGAVFDYFINGLHIGFIDVDDTNYVTAYLVSSDSKDSSEKIYDSQAESYAQNLVLSLSLVEQISEIELQTKAKNIENK